MYIFLDVDGVLNTKKDWERKIYSLNPKCVDEFCNLLKKIDDPKIVLSSTWRNGIARDGSTAVHIDKLQEVLSKSGISSMDKTATAPDGSRSREIDYYLRTHNKDSYIILDDDIDIFELGEKTPNLFRIDPSTGLTKKDVKSILKEIKRKRGK